MKFNEILRKLHNPKVKKKIISVLAFFVTIFIILIGWYYINWSQNKLNQINSTNNSNQLSIQNANENELYSFRNSFLKNSWFMLWNINALNSDSEWTWRNVLDFDVSEFEWDHFIFIHDQIETTWKCTDDQLFKWNMWLYVKWIRYDMWNLTIHHKQRLKFTELWDSWEMEVYHFKSYKDCDTDVINIYWYSNTENLIYNLKIDWKEYYEIDKKCDYNIINDKLRIVCPNKTISYKFDFSKNSFEPVIEDDFERSWDSQYFWTILLTWYAYVEEMKWYSNETYNYVYFKVLNTSSELIFDFIKEQEWNSFVQDWSVWIGCLSWDTIEYSAYAKNDQWEVDYLNWTIIKEDTDKLLNSDENNIMALKLGREKNILGMGAPQCYSHFYVKEVFGN